MSDYAVLMKRLAFSELQFRHAHFYCTWTHVAVGERTFVHTHDFPEVFFVVEGGGVHHVNARPQVIGTGDLVWVEAADVHFFEGTGGGLLRFVNLALEPRWWRTFSGLFVQDLGFQEPGRGPEARLWSLRADDRARAEAVLGRLVLGRRAEDADLIGALLQVSAMLGRARVDAGPRPPAWLKDLVGMMREAGNCARPLAWWQAKAGCSKEHLARCCRQHYNRTLTDLLNEARIARAQAKLMERRETVASIALATGFDHLGHFYALFKKATGHSPLEWQRLQTNATVPR